MPDLPQALEHRRAPPGDQHRAAEDCVPLQLRVVPPRVRRRRADLGPRRALPRLPLRRRRVPPRRLRPAARSQGHGEAQRRVPEGFRCLRERGVRGGRPEGGGRSPCRGVPQTHRSCALHPFCTHEAALDTIDEHMQEAAAHHGELLDQLAAELDTKDLELRRKTSALRIKARLLRAREAEIAELRRNLAVTVADRDGMLQERDEEIARLRKQNEVLRSFATGSKDRLIKKLAAHKDRLLDRRGSDIAELRGGGDKENATSWFIDLSDGQGNGAEPHQKLETNGTD